MLTREQIAALRKPFKPDQIKNKIQTNPKNTKQEGDKLTGWGTVIFYLDSRDVAERLDLATDGSWSDEYSLFGKALECSLTVCGVTRRDVGEADAPKDLYSDSFKRAAVKFGVGAFLYRLPNVLCKMEGKGTPPKVRWELTREAKASLQTMKELAQGGDWGGRTFPHVMLLSDFQPGEDFEEEPVPVEQEGPSVIVNRARPVDAPMAGRSSYDAATDSYSPPPPATQILSGPCWYDSTGWSDTSFEGARHVPSGDHVEMSGPPLPKKVWKTDAPTGHRLLDTAKLEPVPEEMHITLAPDLPAFEPSMFIGKVVAAKKALGIPAEQTPVQASKGDSPITQDERKKLMAVLGSFEVKKKEPVMSLLSFLLKRELTSSNEISTGEARGIINGLSLADVDAWREQNREEE